MWQTLNKNENLRTEEDSHEFEISLGYTERQSYEKHIQIKELTHSTSKREKGRIKYEIQNNVIGCILWGQGLKRIQPV